MHKISQFKLESLILLCNSTVSQYIILHLPFLHQGWKDALSLYQVEVYLYFRSLSLVFQTMSVWMRQNLTLTLQAVYGSLSDYQSKIQNEVQGAGISSFQVSKSPPASCFPAGPAAHPPGCSFECFRPIVILFLLSVPAFKLT